MKKKLEDYVLDGNSENGYRYIGKYYSSELTEKQRRKYGMLQMIGGILAGVYVVGVTCVNSIGNRTPYIVFPMEFILICVAYYVSGGYHLYKSKERMEKRCYEKSYVFTVQSAMVACILSFLSLAGEVTLFVKNMRSLNGYTEHIYVTMLLFLFIMCLMVWKWQRHLYSLAKEVSNIND